MSLGQALYLSFCICKMGIIYSLPQRAVVRISYYNYSERLLAHSGFWLRVCYYYCYEYTSKHFMLDGLCGEFKYISFSNQHVSTGPGVSRMSLNPVLVLSRCVALAKLRTSLCFSFLSYEMETKNNNSRKAF